MNDNENGHQKYAQAVLRARKERSVATKPDLSVRREFAVSSGQ